MVGLSPETLPTGTRGGRFRLSPLFFRRQVAGRKQRLLHDEIVRVGKVAFFFAANDARHVGGVVHIAHVPGKRRLLRSFPIWLAGLRERNLNIAEV